MHVVGQDKCLLITGDPSDAISIFLEEMQNLKNAVEGRRPKRQFSGDKVGPSPLIAFDEIQRLLAIYVHKNVRLKSHYSHPILTESHRIKHSYTSSHSTSFMANWLDGVHQLIWLFSSRCVFFDRPDYLYSFHGQWTIHRAEFH